MSSKVLSRQVTPSYFQTGINGIFYYITMMEKHLNETSRIFPSAIIQTDVTTQTLMPLLALS